VRVVQEREREGRGGGCTRGSVVLQGQRDMENTKGVGGACGDRRWCVRRLQWSVGYGARVGVGRRFGSVVARILVGLGTSLALERAFLAAAS